MFVTLYDKPLFAAAAAASYYRLPARATSPTTHRHTSNTDMSQSGSHTAQTSPSPDARPKPAAAPAPPPKDEPKKKFSTDPVTPWHLESKAVPVRTFAGYEFKLNGWVRQDVHDQRSAHQSDRDRDPDPDRETHDHPRDPPSIH